MAKANRKKIDQTTNSSPVTMTLKCIIERILYVDFPGLAPLNLWAQRAVVAFHKKRWPKLIWLIFNSSLQHFAHCMHTVYCDKIDEWLFSISQVISRDVGLESQSVHF